MKIVIALLVACTAPDIVRPDAGKTFPAVDADPCTTSRLGCLDAPPAHPDSASITDYFVDPAGLHSDAAITIPSGPMPVGGWPVVIPFHRYSGDHTEALSRMGFGSQATWPASPIANKAIILWPDGVANAQGFKIWNATSGCCDPAHAVDDIAYVEAAYTYLDTHYVIDHTRRSVMGLSNGGAMAEAVMCAHPEHWDRAADDSGVAPKPCAAAVAGSTVTIWKDHGDADTTLFWNAVTPHANTMTFQGMSDTYPSADDASQYGCSSFVDTGVVKDYESTAGSETHVFSSTGCLPGVTITLYRAVGGIHSPSWITSKLQPDMLAFLGLQ